MKNIANISFVIITLNEEFSIKKCLTSLEQMPLIDCEVICVDSDSKDQTLSIIKSFRSKIENLRIFQLKNYANAAIARNIGAKKAKKKYIYFIDGDVELNKDFIYEALFVLKKKYDAVEGSLHENQYTAKYKNILKENTLRILSTNSKLLKLSGGIFIIKRNVFLTTGFFNEKFVISEDIEFSLRLSRNYKLLSIPHSMGCHHTIPYSNLNRILNSLLIFRPTFYGMIFKRNLFSLQNLYHYLKGPCFGVFGGGCLLLLFIMILITMNFPSNLTLIAFFIITDIIYGKIQKKELLLRIVQHYIYPFYFLLGIIIDLDYRKPYKVVEMK